MAARKNDPAAGLPLRQRRNRHVQECEVERLLNLLSDGGVSDFGDTSESEDELEVPERGVPDNEENKEIQSDSQDSNGEDEVQMETEPHRETGKKIKKTIQIWNTKKPFIPSLDVTWKGQEHLDNGEDLGSPYSYFIRYIPETMYDTISGQTNLFSLRESGVSVNTDANEIRRLFAMHIIIGVLGFPRIRMYWHPFMKISSVADTMSRNRFHKLRQNLHVTNEQPDINDRVWKVRPFMDSILKRCHELTMEECVCIDEQIIPFKGHLNIKQYVKNKPTPWGLKAYLLCGKSGIVFDFLMYQGKTTPLNSDNVKQYGSTGATVILLCERIPKKESYKLFADNFFSSIAVVRYLRTQGIFYVGTIRQDRTLKCPIKTSKNDERGTMKEYVTKEEDVVVTVWRDNKDVRMVSSLVGKGKPDNALRWCKASKEYMNVDRPEVIALYNKAMGGVDKTDFLIQLYRIFIRSRKWTLRVIFHFLTLAVTNSWQEYKRDARLKGTSKKNTRSFGVHNEYRRSARARRHAGG